MNVPLWVALTARSGVVMVPTIKLAALLAFPPSVATAIWPDVAPSGTVAVRLLLERMLNDALAPLTVTLVVKLRLEPVIVTLVPADPLAGEKPKMAGAGGVWPSTTLRRTAARLGGRAVKKVKPVWVCRSFTEVTKFAHAPLTLSELVT